MLIQTNFFQQLFSHPKPEVLRGVKGHGLGETKPSDTHVIPEIMYFCKLPCQKIPQKCPFSVVFTNFKTEGLNFLK